MAKKAFSNIMAGIDDATAFAKGDRDRGIEHIEKIVRPPRGPRALRNQPSPVLPGIVTECDLSKGQWFPLWPPKSGDPGVNGG